MLSKTNKRRLTLAESGLGTRANWQVDPDQMNFSRSVCCAVCGRQVVNVFRVNNLVSGKTLFVGPRCTVTVFAYVSGSLSENPFQIVPLEKLLNESEEEDTRTT